MEWLRGEIRVMRASLIVVLYLLAGASYAAEPAKPCDGPAHRQFDFWVGDWEVYRRDGKLAGKSRIELEDDGCVIHEHYSTSIGYNGQSLNIYDRSRKVWHQTWVDNAGIVLLLEGGLRGKSMVLEGKTKAADGISRNRITWTPNADGTLRQVWEITDLKGQTRVDFDGLYKKAGR